jgi:hypothetical protein
MKLRGLRSLCFLRRAAHIGRPFAILHVPSGFFSKEGRKGPRAPPPVFLGPPLQEDEGLNMISLRKEIQGLNPEAPVALLHEMSQIAG